jgi:hypothetical protein
MFAYDEETDELTCDGRPVTGQIRDVFDLIAYRDPQWFQQQFERHWEEHDVPGSDEVLCLPFDRWSEYWGEWVDEIAVAYRSSETCGPMTNDGWQKICRVGNIYFVANGYDGGFDVDVIGVDAYAEAIAAADGFVVNQRGEPVSVWDDADDPYPEDLTWHIDNHDLDDEDQSSWPDAVSWQQRLWGTVITHDATGVVLAGPGGSAPLPGPGIWYVVPVPSHHHAELSSTIAAQPVTVNDNGTPTEALLTQYLELPAATRLAESFGADVLWELSADQIRLIRCHPYAVVANALRDAP